MKTDLISLRMFDTRAAASLALAEAVAADLSAVLAAGGRASLAVPGGTTPGPFLSHLGQAELDWPRVRVLPTDERQVPSDSDRSNARLIAGALLSRAPAQFIPLYDPEDSQVKTDADLLLPWSRPDKHRYDAVAAALPLTACVLGMGADGHTASLFPGADTLGQALSLNALLLMPLISLGSGEPRITLTLPALLSARKIYLLMFGADKRAVLDAALQGGPAEDMPIRAVLRGAAAPVAVYTAD